MNTAHLTNSLTIFKMISSQVVKVLPTLCTLTRLAGDEENGRKWCFSLPSIKLVSTMNLFHRCNKFDHLTPNDARFTLLHRMKSKPDRRT